MIADADNFICSFPKELPKVEDKILLLAALLLIDYQFFEDNSKK